MLQAGKTGRAKTIGLAALLNKRYAYLDGLPEWVERAFGRLVKNFVLIVWARSGSGKSTLVYKLTAELMKYGNVLYLSLEEGVEATAQIKAIKHLNKEEHGGKILFANHEMTYDQTVKLLGKRKSPQFVVIDSVQYWDINYAKYKELKALFPQKGFVFISHSRGKNCDGHTAEKIRYDSGIKVYMEGFVAFIKSRYLEDVERVYVMHEQGAREYWGKKYKHIVKDKKKVVYDKNYSGSGA
jgi:hypothetical protein